MNNSSISSSSSFPPAASIAVSGTTLAPAVASASVEQIRALEAAETTKLKRAEEAKAKAEALINSSMERLELIYQWYELAEQASNLAAQQSQVASELNELRNQESELTNGLTEISGARQMLLGDLALPLFPMLPPNSHSTPSYQAGSSSFTNQDGSTRLRLDKGLADHSTTLMGVEAAFPSKVSANTPTPAIAVMPPEVEAEVTATAGFSRNPWWQLSEADLVAMETDAHPNLLVQKWLGQAAQAVRTDDWQTATNQLTRLTRGAGHDSFLAWLGYAATFTATAGADEPGNLREVKAALEKAYSLKENDADERISQALLTIYDIEKPPIATPEPGKVATPPLPASTAAPVVVNKPASITQFGNKTGAQPTPIPAQASVLVQSISDTAAPLQLEQEYQAQGAEEVDFGDDLTFGEETTRPDYGYEAGTEVSDARGRKAGEGSQPTANFSGSSIATNNGRTRTHK